MAGWRDRWQDRVNDLAFRWRSSLRWSAPAWKRTAGSLDRVLKTLAPPARKRALALTGRYPLERWPRLLTVIELHENLHALDLLDRLLPRDLPDGPALDVGSKNGVLLPAQHAVRPGPWDLVELDAHRRYLDLSTRRAHGERMARAFPDCRYLAGSVTGVSGSYALCTWFLPFVHEGPLTAWGLPRRFFDPSGLFGHVVDRLAPGGALLVINQGESERDTQRALFADAGIAPEELGLLQSALSPFRRPRFGFLWRKI